MRNLFKKSLAFCLVAALALTCFVGSFSVSAETTPTATISVTAGDVEVGATEIPVTLTIVSEVGINEALIKVSSDLGDIIAKPVVTSATPATAENAEGATDYNSFFLSATSVPDGNGNSVLGEVTSAEIALVFTNEAGIAAGEYPIAIDVEGVKAASKEEEVIDLAYETVTITVEEAITHECVWGEIKYAVEDGNCVTYQECECGEKNVILSVANVAVTPNPVLASGLAIRFRVKQNAVTGYTDLYGVFTKDTYDGAAFAGESEPETIVAVAQGTNWQFEYTGIASYEMSCTIHIKVYGTDANGNVVLVASSDQSLADFFKGRLATSGKYSDANMNLYADILRYGSESQKAMGYNTDNLANAGVVTTYGSELPTSFTNTTSPSTGFTITPTVVVGNSVLFRIRFLKSEVASYDPSTIRMTIDYTNSYGQADTIEATVADFTDASNGTRYQYEFSSLPASYINDYFAIKIYAGESTEPLATLDYCFQTYASTRYANSSANATLCQAIVAYSNSAAIAFGVK